MTLTAVTKNDFSEAFTKVTTTSPDMAQGLWLEAGDVFVQRANTAEMVGTTARYEGPERWAIFPDLLIRLRPDESRIDGRLLTATLRSERCHRTLRARAKGLAGSMPKIDQKAVSETLIPVPTRDAQHTLVAQVAALQDERQRLDQTVAAAQVRSAALRRAVLKAAFEGRLTGRHTDGEVIEGLAGR